MLYCVGQNIARERIIDGERVTELDWSKTASRTIVRDTTNDNRRRGNGKIYFPVSSYVNHAPTWVHQNPVTLAEMSTSMRTLGWSSITVLNTDASRVVTTAFPPPSFGLAMDVRGQNQTGLSHFHPSNLDRSRVRVNNRTIHSWWFDGI